MDDWGSPWADESYEPTPVPKSSQVVKPVTAELSSGQGHLAAPPARRGSESSINGATIPTPGSAGRHVKSQSVWDVPDFSEGDVWAAPSEKTPGLPVPAVTDLEETVWTPGVRIEDTEVEVKKAPVQEDWGSLPAVDSLEAERDAWNTISPGMSPGLPVAEASPSLQTSKVVNKEETHTPDDIRAPEDEPPAPPPPPPEEPRAAEKKEQEEVEEVKEPVVPTEVKPEIKPEVIEAGDEFDDFGEFEDASEAQPVPTFAAPVSIPASGFEQEKRGLFKPDISVLNNLYPMLTGYPTPPHPTDLIDSTEARKAWYRLTRKESLREHNSASEDYVRVSWIDSKIRTEATTIVSKWASEDTRNGNTLSSTRIGLGSSGAEMFGWGAGGEKIAKIASLDSVMPSKKKRRERKAVVEESKANFGWDVAEFDPLAAQKAAEAKAKAAAAVVSDAKEQIKERISDPRSMLSAIPVPVSLSTTLAPKLEKLDKKEPPRAAAQQVQKAIEDDEWGTFENSTPPATPLAASIPPSQPNKPIVDDWGFFEVPAATPSPALAPTVTVAPPIKAVPVVEDDWGFLEKPKAAPAPSKTEQTAKPADFGWGSFEETKPAPVFTKKEGEAKAADFGWGSFEEAKPAPIASKVDQAAKPVDFGWGSFDKAPAAAVPAPITTARDNEVEDDEWGTFEDAASPAPSATSSIKPFPLQPTFQPAPTPPASSDFDAFEAFVSSRPTSQPPSRPMSTVGTLSNGLKQEDIAMFDAFMSPNSKPKPQEVKKVASRPPSRPPSRGATQTPPRPSKLSQVQSPPETQPLAQRFTEAPKTRPASFTGNDFDAFESMVAPARPATQSTPQTRPSTASPSSASARPIQRPQSMIATGSRTNGTGNPINRSLGGISAPPHRADAFKATSHTRTSSPLSQPSRMVSMNEIAALDIAKANAGKTQPAISTKTEEEEDEGWGDFETVVQSPAAVTTTPMGFPPITSTASTAPPPQTPTMNSFTPLVPTSRPSSVVGFPQNSMSPVQRPQSVSYSAFSHSAFSSVSATAPHPPSQPLPHIASQLASHSMAPSLAQLANPPAQQPSTTNGAPADDDFDDFGDFVSKPAKSPSVIGSPPAGAVASPPPTAWGNFDMLQPTKANTPAGPQSVPTLTPSIPPASATNTTIPASLTSMLQPSKPSQSQPAAPSNFSILQPSKPAFPPSTFSFTDFSDLPAPSASVPPPAPLPISTPTPTPRPAQPPSRPASLPPQPLANSNPYSELNFFEVPAQKPTMGVLLPPSVSTGKRESEEEKTVRRVVEGLPDWGRLIGK